MLLDGESDEDNMRIHMMFIEENRVKSFKDWVFDSCECTPKKVTPGRRTMLLYSRVYTASASRVSA